MQISRRKYNRARKGTIGWQSLIRGRMCRRTLALVKIQKFRRMVKPRQHFRMLRSAVIALQCAIRVKMARKVLKGLQGEQKDIGKLKHNNEALKKEMQSLKAMLAAQAKEGASNAAHEKELEAKQAEIIKLEKRVAELEKQLAAEKEIIEKLEADLAAEKAKVPASDPTFSPVGERTTADPDATNLQMPSLPSNYVSPEIVAKHRRHLGRLEEELKAERNLRREADGEIIKLRAAINGVELNDSEVNALLAQKLSEAPKKAEVRYVFFFFSYSAGNFVWENQFSVIFYKSQQSCTQ